MPNYSPEPRTHVVEDYDFVFSSGQIMPLTIDRAAGDEVDFQVEGGIAIRINMSAKPSKTNPDVMLPAEEVTIFQAHLIAIQKRLRTVTDFTAEQRQEWRDAIKAYGGENKAIH